MEKLIFEYLNSMYPNIYRKLTKFGYELCGYNETNTNWYIVRDDMVHTIMTLFCCNWLNADVTINKWIDTLWVFDEGMLSESERILISKRYNIDS